MINLRFSVFNFSIIPGAFSTGAHIPMLLMPCDISFLTTARSEIDNGDSIFGRGCRAPL